MSVLMLAVLSALLVGALAVAMLSRSATARTQAQSAADLAALAAATAAMYATAVPCEIAHETAQRNDADLVSCVEEGKGVYTVSVQVPAPAGRTATVPARAGPESASP